MKKIVFVQKQESNYDPVTAFFGKKNPSKSKPIIPNTPNTTNNVDKKHFTSGVPIPQKKTATQNKINDITPKTDKKLEAQPRGYPLKQQALKTRELSRKNIKKQSQVNIGKEEIVKNMVKNQSKQQENKKKISQEQAGLQKQKQEAEFKLSMGNIEKSGLQLTSQKQQKQERQKIQNNYKAVRQLEMRQSEYLRKIEQLQSQKQKYIKNQQKLSKLQKDYKALLQKSKENEKIGEQLKQKQSQIKQMLQANTIPFSRKRQVMLTNQLRELKKTNRQLVLRLKNYKGTDLVQLAIQQNREEIMKELYTVDVENQLKQEMNIQMQSLVAQLANKLSNYIQLRTKQKGQRLIWSQQQFFLMQIVKLSEKISLNYLNNYQVCPLPKSNDEAVSAYSLLEQYRKRDQIQKILDTFDVNIALSAQNSQIINQIQQSKSQMVSLRQQVIKTKRKKEINDKAKLNEYLEVYEKRSNFIEILLIQNLFQYEFLRQWIEKIHVKLQQSLNELSKPIAQIKNIVSLGVTAKQSLFFYLQNNIQKLQARFPALKQSIKQIQNNLRDMQKLCSFK